MTSTTASEFKRTSRPRLSPLHFTLLLTLSAFAGCGSNATDPSNAAKYPPAADPHNFTGSWGVYSTSSASNFAVGAFVGNLDFYNGFVSGSFNALTDPNSSCVEDLKASNVKGTIDASNNLIITVPMSTGIATITATLPNSPQAFVTGSYQIDGGGPQCSMPATPMVISQFASVTGTYTGTLNGYESPNVPIPGSAVTISAVITQSASPDSYGEYLISGTVSASGACTESIALQQAGAIGGLVFSQVLLADLDPTSDTMVYAAFQDTDSNDPNCRQLHEGTLTRH